MSAAEVAAWDAPVPPVDELGAVHFVGIGGAGMSGIARILLARVVTRIGDVTEITPEVVEELYAADFDHLQRLYERINTDGEAVGAVTCPHCSQPFEVDLTEIEDGRLGG